MAAGRLRPHPRQAFLPFLLTLLLALFAWGCPPDYEVGREGAGEGVGGDEEASYGEAEEDDALPARIPGAAAPEDEGDADRERSSGQAGGAAGEGSAEAGAAATAAGDEPPEAVRSGAGAEQVGNPGIRPTGAGELPREPEGTEVGGRGRYITHRLAMCIECHTPRGEDGKLLLDRKFEGAPIPFDSAFGYEWAIEAPAIAGMRMYTEEQAIRLLTEGVGRNGRPLRPPMPAFRMTEEDARAVYRYLSRLGG